MANSNTIMIHKLQTAINNQGGRILYQTSQFYSLKQDRPITVYRINRAVWDEESEEFKSIELFKSTSQIQIVLYLRDLWYEMTGIEIPTDNDKWEEIKLNNKLNKDIAK